METFLLVVSIILILSLSVLTRPKPNRKYEFVERQGRHPNPVADAVLRGYNTISRVTEKPFLVRYWSKDYLVLPAKYLHDVRRAPKEQLSFTDTISDVFFSYNWHGDLFKSHHMDSAVAKGMNPQLPKLSPSLFEEAEYVFDKKLAGRDEFVALDLLTDISLRIMTRIIAGVELAHDEKFLKAMTSYFTGNFLTGMIMLKLPFIGRLRDIVAWPLWKYHQVFHQERAIAMILPHVARRIDEYSRGVIDIIRFDAISCTLDQLKATPSEDPSSTDTLHTLAHETMHLVWAGAQSPAISLTAVLFRLLECPEYMAELREEAQAAIQKHGWHDSIFKHLPKMDSFIREVHRFEPFFALNATRLVKGRPFTFSDGWTIPVGTRIGFATEGMQHDPDIVSNPDTFDGFRFAKLATEDANRKDGANIWAASHPSFDNLTFGYGNHACPGRFISIRLIKVMLCHLLLRYDLGWDFKPGVPPKFVLEGASVPNVTQKIRIRKRRA